MGRLAICSSSTTGPVTGSVKPPPMSTSQYCSLTPTRSCLPIWPGRPALSLNMSSTDFSWQKRVISCRLRQYSGANSGASGSSSRSGTISLAKAARRWYTGLPAIRLGLDARAGTSCDCSPAKTALRPASRVTSPAFSSRLQAPARPHRAGTPYSRATEARCPAIPPVSLTSPAARESRGAQRGRARSTTKMPPLGKESMSASLRATTAWPKATPGLTPTPPRARTTSPSGSAS